jgi:predicted membrane GTPase involved in stress response
LQFSGDSYPENAADFFQPLLQWVNNYVRVPHEQTTVEFRLKYFNTSSSRYIFQIMEILHGYQARGNAVKVVWKSQGQDDDMLDTWREIMDELEMPYAVEST